MTTIWIYREKKSGSPIAGFEVKGHTGFADSGEDIVCSAVSVLTQATVQGLQEVIGISVGFETRDGYLYCMLPADITKSHQEKAEILLETMALGLASLAESYGDYIKIIEREV